MNNPGKDMDYSKEYPHKGDAEKLASMGRYGDSMLMHVNPLEVEYLEKNFPGSVTINPETGQPEAFLQFLIPLFSAVSGGIGSVAGMAAPLMSAIGSGVGAAGGALASGLGSVGTALTGAGSAIGSGLGSVGSGVLSGIKTVGSGLSKGAEAVGGLFGGGAESAKVLPELASGSQGAISPTASLSQQMAGQVLNTGGLPPIDPTSTASGLAAPLDPSGIAGFDPSAVNLASMDPGPFTGGIMTDVPTLDPLANAAVRGTETVGSAQSNAFMNAVPMDGQGVGSFPNLYAQQNFSIKPMSEFALQEPSLLSSSGMPTDPSFGMNVANMPVDSFGEGLLSKDFVSGGVSDLEGISSAMPVDWRTSPIDISTGTAPSETLNLGGLNFDPRPMDLAKGVGNLMMENKLATGLMGAGLVNRMMQPDDEGLNIDEPESGEGWEALGMEEGERPYWLEWAQRSPTGPSADWFAPGGGGTYGQQYNYYGR
jgi:hypothetical protein